MSASFPVFTCELAFGSDPGDAAPVWTDVSAYLRGFHISRGRQYELNQSQAGTCDITLKNLDRRFDPTFTGSPYYPNVLPMVPVRLRVAGGKTASATLTATDEITDASRAAALLWGTGQQGGQTDGLASDSSFFVGRAATNLFRRGQCDATTDSTADAGVTVSVDATVAAPFSPQSLKAVVASGTNVGVVHKTATGQAAAAGTNAVASVRFKGVASQSYTHQLVWLNTDASFTVGTKTTFVATGDWQELDAVAVAVAAGKTGDQVQFAIRENGTRAESFWVAHAMLEKGQSVVAPYVATSGGATATKAAARVQAPASLLGATQGWFAARVRMGFSSAAVAGLGAQGFEIAHFGADFNNYISIFYRSGDGSWRVRSEVGGASQGDATKAAAHNAGDIVTVIGYWTSTKLAVSVNGSAFTTLTPTAFPSLGALTTFDIGNGVNTQQLDGDVLWFACGTGTLTDQDAATINAWGDTDPADPYFYNHPAAWKITAVMPFATASYTTPADATLFTGYVERYPQNRSGPSYAETQIQAVDGFELLTNAVLPADTYPAELTGTRVARVLDAAGWSTSARNIATGQSTVDAYTFADADNVQPLTHLQAVADSELGAFYISNDGRATFLDRHSSFGAASQGTFTDQPAVDTTAVGYTDIVASLDKDLIYTDIRVTPTSGVYQEALDSASISKYFLRLLARTVLLNSNTDALDQAEYLLSLYKNPALRTEQVTLTPGSNNNAWQQLLARELSDRITIRAHPPGGGDPLVQDAFVQNIDLTVDTSGPAGAKVVWSLLPAAVQGFWRASFSQASVDTRAGY